MKTVFVTLTDLKYLDKAKRTILDLRTRGNWKGDLVLLCVDFIPNNNFTDFYNVIPKTINHVDTSYIVEQFKKFPIRDTCDNRQFDKLTQWDKLFVFSDYFRQWDRVIFLDAGLRVFDDVENLLSLDCSGKILAQDDAPEYDNEKRFGGIVELACNSSVNNNFVKEFGLEVLHKRYFLNCMWMYDTKILDLCNYDMLVNYMNKYGPICRTNEMTIMNLLFTYKFNLWQPFPEFAQNNKRLFGWFEKDRNYCNNGDKTWRDFCFVKYPITINFNCE